MLPVTFQLALLCENRHSSQFTLDRWGEFEMNLTDGNKT